MDRLGLAKIFYIQCHNPKGMQSLALPAKCVQRNQTADEAAVHVARTSANVTLIKCENFFWSSSDFAVEN